MAQTPINWRKRKKLWKKHRMWKPNRSNKSLHTFCRVCHVWKPDWNVDDRLVITAPNRAPVYISRD